MKAELTKQQVAAIQTEVAAALQPILKKLGGRTRLLSTPPDVYDRMGVLGPKNRSFKDRPNLIAEFDFGKEGKRIILNGHMDTVGAAGMELVKMFMLGFLFQSPSICF